MEDVSKEKTTEEKIEEIKASIEEIYPKTAKAPSFVMIGVGTGLLLVSVIVACFSATLSGASMIPVLVMGIVFIVLSLAAIIFGIITLNRVFQTIERYEILKSSLIEETDNLKQKTKIKKEKTKLSNESDEDTLLRLLSEGKISVEEYKKLSKKEQ